MAANPTFLDAGPTLTTGASAAGGTVNTVSYTVPAGGTSRCLVAMIHARTQAGGTTISSVTYGGTSLTRRGGNAGTGMLIDCWTLLNPTAGTANLVVTFSGNTRQGVAIGTLQDVDQATIVRNTGAGADSSLTTGLITAASSDLIVAGNSYSNNALTDPGGVTNVASWLNDFPGATANKDVFLAATGNATLTWTATPNDGDWHGAFGIPFLLAAVPAFVMRKTRTQVGTRTGSRAS